MISAFSTRKRKVVSKTPICTSCGSRNVSTEEDASVVCLDCGQIIKSAHREVLAEDTLRMVRTRGGGAMTRHVRVQRTSDKSMTPKVATLTVDDCLVAFRTVIKAQTQSLVRLLSTSSSTYVLSTSTATKAAPAATEINSFSQDSGNAFLASQSSLAPLSQDEYTSSPFKHQMSQSSTQSMSQFRTPHQPQRPKGTFSHSSSSSSSAGSAALLNTQISTNDVTNGLTAAVRQVYTEYVGALKNCAPMDVLIAFYPPRSKDDVLLADVINKDPLSSAPASSSRSPSTLTFTSWPRPKLSLTLALMLLALRRQRWPVLAWDICFWARTGRLLFMDSWSHVPEESRAGALQRARAFFVNRPVPSPGQVQHEAAEVLRFMRVNATRQAAASHSAGQTKRVPPPDAWLVLARVCLCMDTGIGGDVQDVDTVRMRDALKPILFLLENKLTSSVVSSFLQTDNFSAESNVALVCVAASLAQLKIDHTVVTSDSSETQTGIGEPKSARHTIMPPVVSSEWDPPWNTLTATKQFLVPGSMHCYTDFLNAHVLNRVKVSDDVMKYSYLLAREGHALKTRASALFRAGDATDVDDDEDDHDDDDRGSGGGNSDCSIDSDTDSHSHGSVHKESENEVRTTCVDDDMNGNKVVPSTAWREVLEQEFDGIGEAGLSMTSAHVDSTCEEWTRAGRHTSVTFANKQKTDVNNNSSLSFRYRTRGAAHGGDTDASLHRCVWLAELGAESLRLSSANGVMVCACKLVRSLLRVLRPVIHEDDDHVDVNGKRAVGGPEESGSESAPLVPVVLEVDGEQCQARLLELQTSAHFAALMDSGLVVQSQEPEL